MAENATDILSIEAARQQIRVDGDVENSIIEQAVKSAVSYIARRTNIPLLDRSMTFDAYPCDKTRDGYIEIPTRDVKSITSIQFWGVTDHFNRDPTGTVDVSTLGRIKEVGRVTRIWGPDAGWPADADELERAREWIIVANVGFDIDKHSEDLRDAVILMARHYFEHPDRLESDFAIMALIGPWMRWSDIV